MAPLAARFKEMDDAISYAVTEILKRGEIAGNLGPNVRAALENTFADTIDQLVSDIDFAKSLDRVGWDPVQSAIADYVARFGAEFNRAMSLGLDVSKVGELMVQNIQGLQDQILGVQEDPKKKVERQAAIFNAQVQLLEAENKAKLADLLVKRATLAGTVAMLKAEAGLTRERLVIRSRGVEAEGKMVFAEAKILQAQVGSLAALDAIGRVHRPGAMPLRVQVQGTCRAGARGRPALMLPRTHGHTLI